MPKKERLRVKTGHWRVRSSTVESQKKDKNRRKIGSATAIKASKIEKAKKKVKTTSGN